MPLEARMLSDILNVSKRNNARDGITGVLMHHDGIFFQILEGDKRAVENCYERILNDRRHSSLSVIIDGAIDSITFPDWIMGYAGPAKISGCSNEEILSLNDLRHGDNKGSIALALADNIFKKYNSF
jgi:hypothetical protein